MVERTRQVTYSAPKKEAETMDQPPKLAFEAQADHLATAFAQLKWKLGKMSELKRSGVKLATSDELKELN